MNTNKKAADAIRKVALALSELSEMFLTDDDDKPLVDDILYKTDFGVCAPMPINELALEWAKLANKVERA